MTGEVVVVYVGERTTDKGGGGGQPEAGGDSQESRRPAKQLLLVLFAWAPFCPRFEPGTVPICDRIIRVKLTLARDQPAGMWFRIGRTRERWPFGETISIEIRANGAVLGGWQVTQIQVYTRA